MTEAELQVRIVKAARAAGWTVRHDPDRKHNPRNEPDLDMTHPQHGRVAAELKSDTGRPTLGQLQRLSELTTAGVRAYLWCPGCEEQIESALGLRPGVLTGTAPVYDGPGGQHQPTAAQRIAEAESKQAAERASRESGAESAQQKGW